MSVISLNALVSRDSSSAREFYDSLDEPVLVTRDGDPYVLIHRVGVNDTGMIMSALPEFIESRKRAEHARAEGRTITAKELRRRMRKERWRRLRGDLGLP